MKNSIIGVYVCIVVSCFYIKKSKNSENVAKKGRENDKALRKAKKNKKKLCSSY
ncbi:hypothetical protein Hdeb2414_s0020g00552161 [Helianthus debilis subsp. tardiflorus]